MEPPGSRAAARRLARICNAHDDERGLRAELIDELRGVVAFDWYAWLLTDPETEVGAAPLADVPSLRDLPRLVRMRYTTAVNRWTQPGARVLQLCSPSENRRERSDSWTDLLDSYGVVDVATLVFRDRFGCWGFLDLWRCGPNPIFDEDEVEALDGIVDLVTTALRRCQAGTFALTGTRLARGGPVVLILSSELEVRTQTPETDRFLRALIPPEEGRAPVPAAAYNVAAQLLALETGVDDHPAAARVHLSGGNWLTLRAARIGGSSPSDQQDIAVAIEPTSAADRVELFGRAHGLSGREAELLRHLSTGADTREMAAGMFLSENTVQDHLKSIFDKTGARSRRTLLAQALGM